MTLVRQIVNKTKSEEEQSNKRQVLKVSLYLQINIQNSQKTISKEELLDHFSKSFFASKNKMNDK